MSFMAILEANDGSIWFGSAGGVYRYDARLPARRPFRSVGTTPAFYGGTSRRIPITPLISVIKIKKWANCPLFYAHLVVLPLPLNSHDRRI